MTIKNALFIAAATTIAYASQVYSQPGLLEQAIQANDLQAVRELLARYSDQPSDEKKTPITPDVIEHQPNMLKGRQRIFERKRIYFGEDQDGKPYYATILDHEKNSPGFGDVELVIFQGNSKLAKFKEPFKVIGTYSDIDKRHELKKAIAAGGGLWCPEQKFFIGGASDKDMCNACADFRQTYTPSKINIKK